MYVRRSVTIAVLASLSFLFLYSVVTGTSLSEIFELDLPVLIAIASLSVTRLIIQGIRFALIARFIIGFRSSLLSMVTVRIGSEFVALVTPSSVGGEAIRALWLKNQGVKIGNALWVMYIEIISDVLATSAISSLGLFYMFLRRSYMPSLLILSIIAVNLTIHLLFLRATIKGKLKLPDIFVKLIRFMLREKSEYFLASTESVVKTYSDTAKDTLKNIKLGFLVSTAILTSLLSLISGLMLWIIYVKNLSIYLLFNAVIAVHVALLLSTIPISPGGTGLSEIGATLFLIEGTEFYSAPAIVLWRIFSYHIPLIISLIIFIILFKYKFIEK